MRTADDHPPTVSITFAGGAPPDPQLNACAVELALELVDARTRSGGDVEFARIRMAEALTELALQPALALKTVVALSRLAATLANTSARCMPELDHLSREDSVAALLAGARDDMRQAMGFAPQN